jgi:ABC-2 type transport system ATP-binding protein
MVGLDPIAQRSLGGRLRALVARGSAVLLTTHQLAQAEELATDAGLLFDGRLLARGAPGALRTSSGLTGALSEVFFALAGDRPA